MSKNVLETLKETIRGRVELNVPLLEMTTIRIGGPADVVVHPADRKDLSALLKLLNTRNIAVQPIGNGSSIIVRDNGIRGAVICLKEGFTVIEPKTSITGDPLIRADAGAQISDLVDWSVANGFGGLEFLNGIPGTVGGAIVNNAQGFGAYAGDLLVEVEAMDPMGNTHILPKALLKLGDSSSNLAGGFIIVSATFRGQLKDPKQADIMARNFASRRRSNYPMSDSAVGMVFRNTGEEPVEKLIESCGLKGVRVGDAEVSRLNANFIINLGNAEAVNVVSLIGMVQERVYVKHKVKLETALSIVGSWQKGKMRIKE